MVYSEYTWLFAVGLPISFIAAFGIGANDVANSFGSSVGTKAITMWQAVIIAGVCEFCGAFFLGASVSSTIKGGIADPTSFKDTPALFMWGFFCVLITAAFWDNFACHLGLPVSTTHTTVGAVVGFALVAGGPDAVIWYQSKDEFPFYSGFTTVISSWFVSPLAAGIVVSIVYAFMRTFVLRSKNSFTIAFWLLPLFVGAIFGLIVGFIMQVGAKNGAWEDHSDGFVAWVSALFALGAALFTLIVVMPLLKKKALAEDAELQRRVAELQAAKDAAVAEKGGMEKDGVSVDTATKGQPADADVVASAMRDLDLVNGSKEGDFSSRVSAKYHAWVEHSKFGQAVFQNRVSKALTKSLFYDVHDVVKTNDNVAEVWANAEVFDFKTERLFRYLQVFSAMSMAFAHGSNDVANAMGPLTAIFQTWEDMEVPGKKTETPKWILAVGGIGIVCGLATYGYKIMRVLGVEAVKLTNVRGFVCEWSTALVVCVSSRYGLPVSTTQVISGSIISIGLWEGRKGVNWRTLVKILFGWVLTIFVAIGVCAALTSIGLFSPNKNASNNMNDAADVMNGQTLAQIQSLNATGAVPASQLQGLNDTLTDMYAPVSDVVGSADLQVETFNLYNSTMLAQ